MKKLMFAILRAIGRKWVLDYTNDLLTRPENGNDLDLAFMDDKGRAYYRYPDGMMPVIRMGAVQTYTSYLAVALTPDLIDKAFDDVKTHLAHGDTLKAGAVLTSLQEFQRSCVNIDAFLNILAAKYVREDEDASGQDSRIHQEKLDFLESKINDTAFFFQVVGMEGTIKAVRNFHKGCRDITERLQGHKTTTRKPNRGYKWDEIRQEIGNESYTFRKFIRYIAEDDHTFNRFWRMPSSEFLFELSIFVERKVAEHKAATAHK